MGEAPPGAPILLFLLSLAGSGAPGGAGEESRSALPWGAARGHSGLHRQFGAPYGENEHWPQPHRPHSPMVSQEQLRRADSARMPRAPGWPWRALPWLGRRLRAPAATHGGQDSVGAGPGTPLPPAALSLPQEGKDPAEEGGPARARLNATAPWGLPGPPAAGREPRCRCPDGGTGQAPEQPGKGQWPAGLRAPTPRTAEAAWAASALTFLLVALALAVLYTRLHRRCHRGRSLYWPASGEEGQETVAAVIKRRLLAVQGRRKKRARQPRLLLLPDASSDTSE